MASCSQDDLLGPANGEGNYNITVKLPADMATRALSDGYTADILRYAVYDAEDNSFVFEDQTTFGNALQTTVSLNLPQSKSYKIAFFAVSNDGQNVWQFDAEGAEISVNYGAYDSADNLKDAYDCFYELYKTGEIGTTPTSETVTLYRPVAQINWGTNDLNKAVTAENAFGPNGEYILSTLTIAYAPTSFNLLTKEVGEVEKDVTITGLASPAAGETSAAWQFPVDPETYKYIAMQYVLAPQEAGVYDLKLDVNNSGVKGNGEITNDPIKVSSAPVQANHRTNIYGALLTNPTEFTVVKDPNWGVPDYDPSLELALQRGGYFTLTHDFTLSKSFTITKNLTIDLNGYNITYDVEGAYDKQQEGMFYVTDGASLTIKGNGGILEPNDDYTVIWVANGQLTIEGGNFEAPAMAGNIVYVSEGTAYIKGGTYKLYGQELDAANQYPINCNDAAYKAGKANMVVTGGSYYNFNPAGSRAEGQNPRANYVAKGYNVVTSGTPGDQWFTVVADDANVVETANGLADALANAKDGDTIYVLSGTDYTMPVDFNKSVTVKGLGADVTTISTPMAYNASTEANLTFEDLTMKAFVNTTNHTSMGFRGAASVTFNNVNIEGQFYVFTGDATFNNCTFTYNDYTQRNSDFQLVQQSSGTVNINNCVMNCGPQGAFSIDTPWNVTTPSYVGGNANINGLTVSATAANTNNAAVININTKGFTSGGTVTISNVTFDSAQFPKGLWQEVNGPGQTTNLFNVIVK